MKATPCPQDFKDFLKTTSILELVQLAKDLKRFPLDAEYYKSVQDEIKIKSLNKIKEEQ